jgi:hypothetical protein
LLTRTAFCCSAQLERQLRYVEEVARDVLQLQQGSNITVNDFHVLDEQLQLLETTIRGLREEFARNSNQVPSLVTAVESK